MYPGPTLFSEGVSEGDSRLSAVIHHRSKTISRAFAPASGAEFLFRKLHIQREKGRYLASEIEGTRLSCNAASNKALTIWLYQISCCSISGVGTKVQLVIGIELQVESMNAYQTARIVSAVYSVFAT